MAGFSTNNTDHLIRSDLWSSDLKEVLLAELGGMRHIRMLSGFPDGDTFNIPSIGQAESYDYTEGQDIRYNAMDTGNFTFSITDYKASGTYITNKMKQDSYLMNELVASFVPKQERAIMEDFETKLLALGPNAQTASDPNTINGGRHRMVGSGTNQVITINDFARAKYALQKANVPMNNLIAIVDPSVEITLGTQTNLVNLSNNPRWEGIVNTGMSTGTKFITNVFGFDVYVSHFLKSGISETVSGTAVTNGVANLFFSADASVTPYVGAIRQPVKVESEYNKDKQREEYVTTMRYGLKCFRPENQVVIITDNSRVYS